MSAEITRAIHCFAELMINMERTWNAVGENAPTLNEMDGNMTAMELIIIMSKNDIRFTKID